jgi:ankyrin repeat protein
VDVNARDKDNWTSLHWAAFKGRVEVAQVLLDHGANANLETEGEKRRCTWCHEADTNPKNKVSVLHGYYWSAVWT